MQALFAFLAADAENCDAAKQISDARDRKLLPGPSLSNQCAANVPQDLQTREFFEAFEGHLGTFRASFCCG